MRYLGTYPDFGMHFMHAFDQYPLPEFASLSHVSEMRCDHSRVLGPHVHRGVEICYVAAGRLVRTSDRQRTLVHPGECCITPAQERHGGGCEPGHPCHYFSVAFDPAHLSQECLEPQRQDQGFGVIPRTAGPPSPLLTTLALAQRVVAVGPEVEVLFRRMLAELERVRHDDGFGRRLGALMIRTQLMELLILLLQARHHRQEPNPSVAPTPTSTRRLRRAFQELLEWLPSRLSDPPTLVEMATRVRLSPTHFCRAFTREAGESPLECLSRLRLQAAAQALGEGHQDIATISRTLGFRSPQYFSERFHRWYGLTPTQWRARRQALG